MNKNQIEEAAELLWDVEVTRKSMNALTSKYEEVSIEDAYKIQSINIDRRIKNGAVVIGKKIGLTSKAMQNLLGISVPDYGVLLDTMITDENTPISISENFLQPKVEVELAFILEKELKGPGVTVADVMVATKGVMASFEIVDSRVTDWKIKLQDTIADNASSGMLVLGSKLVSLSNIDLRSIGVVFEKNGEIIDTAAGAAVLGNPAVAVAWLANKLSEYDIALNEGEIILSGAFTKAVEINENDVFTASIGGIDTVKAKFIK